MGSGDLGGVLVAGEAASEVIIMIIIIIYINIVYNESSADSR